MLCTLILTEMHPYASRRVCLLSVQSSTALQAYQSEQGLSGVFQIFDNFNFTENDGVETEVVVNYPDARANYATAVYGGGTSISRWFVTAKVRTTNYAANQYRLHLRRDLLADYFNTWSATPAFIRKGWINDPYSPFLFNKEDMTFNAIKRQEVLLPDETGIQWIVGYIARNADLNSASANIGGAVTVFPDAQKALPNALVFDTVKAFENAVGVAMKANFIVANSGQLDFRCRQYLQTPYNPLHNVVYSADLQGHFTRRNGSMVDGDEKNGRVTYSQGATASEVMGGVSVSNLLAIAYSENVVTTDGFNYAMGFFGRPIYISSEGRNYRLDLQPIQRSMKILDSFTPNANDSLFAEIDKRVRKSGTGFSSTGTATSGDYTLKASIIGEFTLNLIPEAEGGIQATLTRSTLRPHLEDAPYDMFCIPYADGVKMALSAKESLRLSKSAAWATAVALVENLSQGTYDLQLLPYCPAREVLKSPDPNAPAKGVLSCDGMEVDYGWSGTPHRNSDGAVTEFDRKEKAAVVIWCRRSTFSFYMNPTLPESFRFPLDPEEVKVRNETEKARLVSPNLAGGFDFSPMMNGGVRSFRADCTYKPFNPYIHISPVFAHMYGGDFGDARGLVCGGDFSLPRITDAWESYQQSNKNYQSIFDREIQNMEVTNHYSRVSDVAGAVTGAIQATANGATSGLLMSGGNPIAGAVGGLVSGAASAVGGAIDVNMNNALRAEALDYKKDMFGFQLGNIRALPQSLAKTAAQNANNRPFPFIEWYSATDEEIQALKDKIDYDGETVGVIATPTDYMKEGGFIQCALAGSKPAGVSSEIWSALTDELMKGCYICGEDS